MVEETENATNEQEVCSLALQSRGLKCLQLSTDATTANLAEEEERRYDLCLHLLLQRDEERE